MGRSIWGKLGMLLSLVVWHSSAMAHEVTPTIADFQVTGQEISLDLRLNVEAFVSGIDLDGMENTDTAAQAQDYDTLRALSADELAPMVRQFAEDWLSTVRVTADGDVALSLARVDIPEVGNTDLPRASSMYLTGTLPAGAQTFTFGWPKGAGAVVLRQHGVEAPYTGYLNGGDTSPEIGLSGGSSKTTMQVFVEYIPVGFDHILPKGLDHILFVLGLFFFSARMGPLLVQISTFTVAHTITLALGAMGWVAINPAIVEPLIALSIVYVAVENIFVKRLHVWRPALIFGFGLLHGLGFASVLGEFGLPSDQFVAALLGFNIGVEVGQLTVVAIAFAAVGVWFRKSAIYHSRVIVPASAFISCVGAYWFVERVFL